MPFLNWTAQNALRKRHSACTKKSERQNERGNMRARTTLLIVFVAGIFVFATVSHGVAAQTTSEQQPTYQQNQPGNNPAVSPNAAPGAAPQSDITPGVGNTQPPVARRQVGWGWLILGLVIGFALGAVTMGPRRRYTTSEDIRRDRAA